MGGFGANTVESAQRQMVLHTLKKTGLGTPVISGSAANFFSVVDNGAGDYNINPNSKIGAFAQVPEVMVMPTTNDRICRLGTVSASGIQVLVEDLSGAAAEGDFHIFISGCLARDLIG
jgi:hypothetical protein